MIAGGVRGAIAALLAALLVLPIAIAMTFLLLPMWTWMEAHWGVEAVGHASLSAWCFLATWIALALPAAGLAWQAFRRRPMAEQAISS